VLAAPGVWAGAWVLSVALALPLAAVLRDMIAGHLGASLVAETVARGADSDWWQQFSAQARGLGATFTPSVIGFAAVLQNLSDLLDNRAMHAVVAGVVGAWLVLWSFLAGGVLDRYARGRALGTTGFFAACGTHFWRLLRLGTVALLLYWLLFTYVHAWLFDEGLLEALTRQSTVERNDALLRAAFYAIFVGLLAAVNLVVDYARVRVVVEDRRSALFALLAGARFVRRHWLGAISLYALNAAGFLVVVAAYAALAPGASIGARWEWTALLIGQLYVVARLGVKLGFYASQCRYFQSALAHADYVAAPAPEWPESPAVEAVREGPPAPGNPARPAAVSHHS
jgi:hypothetical protein